MIRWLNSVEIGFINHEIRFVLASRLDKALVLTPKLRINSFNKSSLVNLKVGI